MFEWHRTFYELCDAFWDFVQRNYKPLRRRLPVIFFVVSASSNVQMLIMISYAWKPISSPCNKSFEIPLSKCIFIFSISAVLWLTETQLESRNIQDERSVWTKVWFLFRLAGKAAPLVTSSCSGLTGWSWSTTSATAPASRSSASSCSWSAAAGRCRRHLLSSWETNGTCSTAAASPARRDTCWLWRSAAASSKSRRRRRTTACCWCSTSWSTWSGRRGRWGRAWQASEASSGACRRCSGRNGPNELARAFLPV